jgi:hypothetical protein
MKTCTMTHFLEAVKPWLDKEYIQSVQLRGDGGFVLNFADNVKNVYRIDDCDRAQLEAILDDFRKKGISVLE